MYIYIHIHTLVYTHVYPLRVTCNVRSITNTPIIYDIYIYIYIYIHENAYTRYIILAYAHISLAEMLSAKILSETE